MLTQRRNTSAVSYSALGSSGVMYERAAIPDPCPLCKNSMGFETLWCTAVYISPLHIDTPENGMDPLRSNDTLSLPPPSPATSPSSGTPHPYSDCCRTGENRKDIRLRGSRFWCIFRLFSSVSRYHGLHPSNRAHRWSCSLKHSG